jgi:hypothetical protein
MLLLLFGVVIASPLPSVPDLQRLLGCPLELLCSAVVYACRLLSTLVLIPSATNLPPPTFIGAC